MDQEIKKQWVADLRANADKQGKGVLNRRNEQFCCLGRLTELFRVSDANEKGQDWVPAPYGDPNGGYRFDGNSSSLSNQVLNWCQLSIGAEVLVPAAILEKHGRILGSTNSHLINYYKPNQPISLATLNDFGVSFPVIADIIEASSL